LCLRVSNNQYNINSFFISLLSLILRFKVIFIFNLFGVLDTLQPFAESAGSFLSDNRCVVLN
jgi:hypothetical protein